MNAAQKTAVLNLSVASVALVAVAFLLPVLGERAMGAFGILGLTGLAPWFFRSREGGVAADERDSTIDRSAALLAFGVACMTTFMSLAGLALWYGDAGIPSRMVWWLLWLQFAILYATRGGAALALYGSGRHAA